MKLRQEEVERNAQNAWKLEDFQKDTLFQKLVKKFKPQQPLTSVKANFDCVCCC